MTEGETTINWKMGGIAIAITVILFILNIFLNPPYIDDKEKPAISCDSNGICEYPQKTNPYYICGPILIIFILIGMLLFGQSYFSKKAYIMTFSEAYRKIPVEDMIAFNIPEIDKIDPCLIVPKDGGKSLFVRYREHNGYSYIKLNLMSDFKSSATDFSRKSPIIAWTSIPISPSTAMTMMRSDTDTFKKLSEIDRMAENLMDKPMTAEMWKENYEAEQKRKKEIASGGNG